MNLALAWLIMRPLDDIDARIIRHLVADGRMTNAQVGRLVGLSPNATGVRIANLFRSGVLSGVHARVNHAALGRSIEAIIDCSLADPADVDPLLALVARDDRVLESLFVTGTVDYRLRVVVASTDDLHDLLIALDREGGVGSSDTRLVLKRHETAGLPGTPLSRPG